MSVKITIIAQSYSLILLIKNNFISTQHLSLKTPRVYVDVIQDEVQHFVLKCTLLYLLLCIIINCKPLIMIICFVFLLRPCICGKEMKQTLENHKK